MYLAVTVIGFFLYPNIVSDNPDLLVSITNSVNH